MSAVAFNYAAWILLYPEFAGVSEPQATVFFRLAGLYWQNSTCNPSYSVDNGVTLLDLLNMVTAHIAWLQSPRDAAGLPSSTGNPAAPIVGRIGSASEGSVSVSVEWKGSGSPSEDWFVQTKYGAAFWQATAQWRTFRYQPQPTYVYGGGSPLRNRWPPVY